MTGPELLSYEELLRLYEDDNLPELLNQKLDRLLTTPFVGSSPDTKPIKPYSPPVGRVLRVVSWNIERGIEYGALEALFSDSLKFEELIDARSHPPGSKSRELILQQAQLMREADIIVLNEVDWGLKRSGYRNVAEDLATSLNMNYAYGVEFVEIDPIALGTEEFEEAPIEDQRIFKREIAVDPTRVKGLHGAAILSRFPLENVRIVRYRHQAYDWYAEEKNGFGRLERARRRMGEVLFLKKTMRQVRRGGRMMLVADAVDPEIPEGRVTVVATHLAARARPADRVKQLQELLEEIKGISNPVIVAGDMNTSGRNALPISVRREIKKRFGRGSYWLRRSARYFAGIDFSGELVRQTVLDYRKFRNPTARSIPVLAPNSERQFFSTIRNFRFDDGGAFDFRGDHARSMGSRGSVLANSNQRKTAGFVPTGEVERTIALIGRFKLDWIFVKPPSLREPRGPDEPYTFAPHFGRTLRSLNYSIPGRISDHNPIAVDLPYEEPNGI